jgi:hypothetical protein
MTSLAGIPPNFWRFYMLSCEKIEFLGRFYMLSCEKIKEKGEKDNYRD